MKKTLSLALLAGVLTVPASAATLDACLQLQPNTVERCECLRDRDALRLIPIGETEFCISHGIGSNSASLNLSEPDDNAGPDGPDSPVVDNPTDDPGKPGGGATKPPDEQVITSPEEDDDNDDNGDFAGGNPGNAAPSGNSGEKEEKFGEVGSANNPEGKTGKGESVKN
jgi:hypothetical protein